MYRTIYRIYGGTHAHTPTHPTTPSVSTLHPDSLLMISTLECLQITRLIKGFPTLLTMVRSLSCVNSLVCLQNTRVLKGFPTLLTMVRSLSYVNALVFLKNTRVLKGFPTLLTMVRSLSCVNALVSLQVTRLTKGFPTMFTRVASGSVCWNLECRVLDGSWGGSDWLLRGGCIQWEGNSLRTGEYLCWCQLGFLGERLIYTLAYTVIFELGLGL